MNNKIYNNLFQLILEARAHIISNESKVVLADDPKQLRVGWLCEKTNTHYLINYRLAFNSQSTHSTVTQNTINRFREFLRTSAGRIEIAKFINKESKIEKDFSKYLDHMCKLLAFW